VYVAFFGQTHIGRLLATGTALAEFSVMFSGAIPFSTQSVSSL
jgi:hypothetical protein